MSTDCVRVTKKIKTHCEKKTPYCVQLATRATH